MTPRQRHGLGILASCAAALVFLSLRSCAGADRQLTTVVSSRPSVRHARRLNRVTSLRNIRATGRAQAGYPGLQTAANVTRVAANLSGLLNPIGWFH